MRSRITIFLKDKREIAGWADERYRGGPENPLSDEEVEAKVHSLCEGVLNDEDQKKLIASAWGITDLHPVFPQWHDSNPFWTNTGT